MQVKRIGEKALLKLEKGDNVLESLSTFCLENGVTSGSVIWGIGMIRESVIGYFNGKEYVKEKYSEDEPKLHIHVGLAGENHQVVGGHLFSGTADPLLEVHLEILPKGTVHRRLNQNSGLTEFDLS
jgi:predicted DNA-binding protein with PD1-like motif